MKAWLGALALGLLIGTPSVGVAASGGGNQCPEVSPIVDQTVNELELLTLTISATDPDGDPVTYWFHGLVPDGAAIDRNTGVFTFTPTEEQGGVYTIGVMAQDGSLECADGFVEFFKVTVYGDDGANCPVLDPIGDLVATEGQLLTFNATATDADGDPLLFSLVEPIPTSASIDPSTGVLTWTPAYDQAGAYEFTVQVSDNAVAQCTDSETIQVTVLDAPPPDENECPVLSPIADQTVNELSLLTFTITATDPDGDPTYFVFASVVPDGASIDPNTGVFSWTPTEGQGPGVYGISVIAQDQSLACADGPTESFQITVNEVGGENQCPELAVIGDKTVTEGQLLTFTATATDADGDPLAYSLVNPIPTGAAIDPSTGVFTWTPTSDQGPGASDVTVQVSDNAATPCTDSEIIHVTVLDAGGGVDHETVAEMIGRYNPHRQELCFRIKQGDADFDLREAELSTIVLLFEGNTIDATRTHVAVDCDECFECDGDGDDDDAVVGPHAVVGDDDGDDDGDDCDESECEASHLRACFTMSQIHELFGDDVLAGLRESEIHGTLSDGSTFVATIGPKHLDDKPGDGNGNGHADNGDRGKHPLKLQIRPNPLNPKAEIRFTLARAGQVRIALYDLRGRVVRTILDERRSAGDHVVSWEGTSDRAGRVASGVYFLRVEAPQGEDMQRVTVLK